MEEIYCIEICESKSEVLELENLYKQFTPEESRNLLLNFQDTDRRFYKISTKDSVIGIGCVVKDWNKFEDFKRFIYPKYRHKKAGDALLDFIIEDAINLNKSYLSGYYHGKDEKVFEYFKSKGFQLSKFDIATRLFLKLNRDLTKLIPR